MENRKATRVQFFNARDEDRIQPVWVFRHTSSDAILGLLVDISSEGVQILTGKDVELTGEIYQLMIFGNEEVGEAVLTVLVNRKWSTADGTLYFRHGFAFEPEPEICAPIVQKILARRNAGERFWRCELIDLSVQER